MNTIPCLICNKALKSAYPVDIPTQPYRGTNFETMGHYGSTVFDECNNTRLSINLCDPCLVHAASLNRVALITPLTITPPKPPLYEYWKPYSKSV